jgi:hypothetical protein
MVMLSVGILRTQDEKDCLGEMPKQAYIILQWNITYHIAYPLLPALAILANYTFTPLLT